ncbi:hypothetical protein TVAGG3_1047490 [Trichomonas vaginalis G3]|nr:hypothetical protein TVAGG3_1047490 [Trichomonas vaginalis G3]KAI5493981.1 hypothetical protein TVAGG3_1047490 [Trichomonas vaginalis G3]
MTTPHMSQRYQPIKIEDTDSLSQINEEKLSIEKKSNAVIYAAVAIGCFLLLTLTIVLTLYYTKRHVRNAGTASSSISVQDIQEGTVINPEIDGEDDDLLSKVPLWTKTIENPGPFITEFEEDEVGYFFMIAANAFNN